MNPKDIAKIYIFKYMLTFFSSFFEFICHQCIIESIYFPISPRLNKVTGRHVWALDIIISLGMSGRGTEHSGRQMKFY